MELEEKLQRKPNFRCIGFSVFETIVLVSSVFRELELIPLSHAELFSDPLPPFYLDEPLLVAYLPMHGHVVSLTLCSRVNLQQQ